MDQVDSVHSPRPRGGSIADNRSARGQIIASDFLAERLRKQRGRGAHGLARAEVEVLDVDEVAVNADRPGAQGTGGQRALMPPPPYSTTAFGKKASKSRYRLQGRFPVVVQRVLSGKFMHRRGCNEGAHEPLNSTTMNGGIINCVQTSGGLTATVKPCEP